MTNKIIQKFRRFSRSLHRLVRAHERLAEAQRQIDEQLAVDGNELARRKKARAALAGTWLLSRERQWFDAPEQRARFVAWLDEEVDSPAAEVRLFAPDDADADLLTPERVAALATEVGAGHLFPAAAPSVEPVPVSEAESRADSGDEPESSSPLVEAAPTSAPTSE